MMKKTLTTLLSLLFFSGLFAQVPQAFAYQAIARDSEGKALSNENVNVFVRIIQDGLTVYQENNNLTTNELGLINVQIGAGNPASFADIDWDLGDCLLSIKVSGAINIETTAPILSVPYALLSEEVVHEKQALSLNGAQLSIDGGNTVTLPSGTTYSAGSGIDISGNTISSTDQDPDPGNEIQQIDLAGNLLSLSNGGGNVTLPTGTTYSAGSGIDISGNTISSMDDSATNEIQQLSFDSGSNQLSISGTGGNSVTLLNSPWQATTGGIHYEAGKVSIGTDDLSLCCQSLFARSGIAVLNDQDERRWHSTVNMDGSFTSQTFDATGEMRVEKYVSNGNQSYIGIRYGAGRAQMESNIAGESFFYVTDTQGNPRATMAIGSTFIPFIAIYDDSDDAARVSMWLDATDRERVELRGPNHLLRVKLAPYFEQANNGGSVMVLNENEKERGNLYASPDGNGAITLFNSDNSVGVEVFAESPVSKPGIILYNDIGTFGALMKVDNSTGLGNLFLSGGISIDGDLNVGGMKNFVSPHPSLPGKEIVYACIEGPEAAVYLRGTAQLIEGEAKVIFPENFTLVSSTEGMTIQTSPHSAESKGLAAVERSAEGFRVKELFGGNGNYAFDWEVKAVRKGYENYQVIRDKKQIDGRD